MRKYYTRPCNFHYGNYAKKLIKRKKALPLAGNPNIAFDQLEIFNRKKRGFILSKTYPITELEDLDKETLSLVKTDLKKICKELFNENVGKIVFLILFFYPIFFGHMGLNSKDTIIAFSHVWIFYLSIKYIKKQTTKHIQCI